jgi:hypothetical protein
VEKYFELEGYFVRENVKFPVPGNYSDIDLIGTDNQGNGLVVEVKSWAAQGMGATQGKKVIDWLTSPLYNKAVATVLGEDKRARKVLVPAWILKGSKSALEEYAKQKGIELIPLTNILKNLFEELDTGPNYDSEMLQLLRLLKLACLRGEMDLTFR